MTTVLLAYLAVFVAAATPWLEVLLVVPAAIVAGLSPAPVAVVAATGNVVTLVPVVFAGHRIREWRRRRRPPATATDGHGAMPAAAAAGRSRRARRLFDRFGLPGLALLGPLVTGIHVAALVAVAAGSDRRRALLWLSAGVFAWSAVMAVLTVLGVEALVDPDSLPRIPGTER